MTIHTTRIFFQLGTQLCIMRVIFEGQGVSTSPRVTEKILSVTVTVTVTVTVDRITEELL